MIKHITADEVKTMTGTEGLVLQGCCGDPGEWVSGINEMLTENGILLNGDTLKNIFVFEHEGLTNMLFSMDDVQLNIGRMAAWRLNTHETFGGTWLSDYLPNHLGVSIDEPTFEGEASPIVSFGEKQSPYRDEGYDGPHEDDAENNTPFVPISVYIENSRDESIGGFTVPLPCSAKDLQPFFDGAEIISGLDIKIIEAGSPSNEALNSALEGIFSILPQTQDTLNELNCLAAKIMAMHPEEYEIFAAAVEADKHSGSLSGLINITENLDKFYLQSAYTAKQYGEFRSEYDRGDYAEAIEKLAESDDSELAALVSYIETLESHIDAEAYGKTIAEKENGTFTERGYLTEYEDFKEIYRGQKDIPEGMRLIPYAEPPVVVYDTDLAALVLGMHAVSGDYMRGVQHSLQILANGGGDFFIKDNGQSLSVTPAANVFHFDTEYSRSWLSAVPSPDIKVYLLTVSDTENGAITGSLFETHLQTVQAFAWKHGTEFTLLTANLDNGDTKVFTPDEWNKLELYERDKITGYTKQYDPVKEEIITVKMKLLQSQLESRGKSVSAEEFLSGVNSVFMSKAANPQPDMLRLSPEAAKTVLARSDADVFRLTGNGPEKMSPIEAAKTGLRYSADREFAVKREDISGVIKWAEHTAGEMLRQIERTGHKKSRDTAEL